MARVSKAGSGEIGHVVIPISASSSAWLRVRPTSQGPRHLCACSTRRVTSNESRSLRTHCARRLRAEWCRLGERAAGASAYVETRFG